MKKAINFLIVLGFFFLLDSCTWKLPEKISVKTEAAYSFCVGNVDKDFNSYFSTDTIAAGDTGGTVFDYYPNHSQEGIKQFLMEIPIQEIPIDFSQYFSDTDIAGQVQGLSFDKTITIPNVNLNVNQDIPGTVLTIAASSNTSVSQPVQLTITTEANATIDTGSVDFDISIPSSWTGVTVDYTITGFTNPAVNGTGNKKKIDLAGEQFNGNKNISVNVTFNGLTSGFNYSGNAVFTAKATVTKYASIEATLDVENTSMNPTPQAISQEMQHSINSVKFKKSGLKGKYINTLPAGNDITLTTASVFLMGSGRSGSKTLTANQLTETNFACTPTDETETDTAFTSSTGIDFSVNIGLPGATSANPKKMILQDVEPNKEYRIKVDMEPEINWTLVNINSDGAASNDTISTGLNISQIFDSFTNALGGDFADHCTVKNLPILIYASAPDMESFDNTHFIGTLNMFYSEDNGVTNKYATNPDGEIKFIEPDDGTGTMPFKTMPVLTKEGEDQKTVVTDIYDYTPSSERNMNKLLNLTKDDTAGSIFIKYNLKFEKTGATGSFAITREDYETSNTQQASIIMKAYVLIPLQFDVDADVKIDVGNMMGLDSNHDLLGRSAPSSSSQISDFMEGVRFVRLRYKTAAVPFVSIPVNTNTYVGTSLSIDWDRSTGNAYSPDISPLNEEENDVYIDDLPGLMEMYPLAPEIAIVIPQGVLNIPRNSKFDSNIQLGIQMDKNHETTILGDKE